MTIPFIPLLMGQMQRSPDFNPHAHKGGIRGGLLHLFGADKMDPELGALLTPEQQERVRPGLMSTIGNAVLTGRGPQAVQRDRAAELLGLQDLKAQRDAAAQQAQTFRSIQARAAQIQDPQQRIEFIAREAAAAGILPVAEQATKTADVTRPRTTQPMAVQRQENVLGPDGRPYIVYTDGQGNEIRREPQYTAPRTAQDNAIVAIDDGSGNPVYVPRAEAVGQRPWQPQRTQISVREQAKVDGAREGLELADWVESELNNYPDAIGLRGMLWTPLLDRLDKEGVGVRSAIETLTGELRYGRFGGALTATEAAKALRWLPNDRDDYAGAVKKLNNLRVFLRARLKSLSGEAQPDSTSGAGGGAAPSVDELMKKYGLTPPGNP